MYLTVIAWLYVVLMMSAAEAASPQGTLLGAITTFALYGLLPLSILIYIMGTPARRRARKAQEARQAQLAQAEGSDQPDAGGHASAGLTGQGTGPGTAATVREKS
jgi:membrane protein implicated in regulation of membrane protease activity